MPQPALEAPMKPETPDDRVPLSIRLLFCFATSALVSLTAYFCAWVEYGKHFGPVDPGGEHAIQAEQLPTFWQFTLKAGGIQITCILAGVATLTICFLASREWRKTRWSYARVLVAGALTAFFACMTAVA